LKFRSCLIGPNGKLRGWSIISACLLASSLRAQDSYEIQVYGSETVAPRETMVESHSNYTFKGNKNEVNGVLPNYHAFHETIEVTHGFTPWFETGFYLFTSIQPGRGWEWVGNHIRPRVRVPEEWHWPVGVSLSTELGYQRRAYSEDTWTWEIRPIIDKQIGRWYLALNPSFERALHGPGSSRGFEFAPSAKVSCDLTKKVALDPHTKRVVLSNHATPDIRLKCRELGADEVFDKSNELDAMLLYCNRLRGDGHDALFAQEAAL